MRLEHLKNEGVYIVSFRAHSESVCFHKLCLKSLPLDSALYRVYAILEAYLISKLCPMIHCEK